MVGLQILLFGIHQLECSRKVGPHSYQWIWLNDERTSLVSEATVHQLPHQAVTASKRSSFSGENWWVVALKKSVKHGEGSLGYQAPAMAIADVEPPCCSNNVADMDSRVPRYGVRKQGSAMRALDNSVRSAFMAWLSDRYHLWNPTC